MTPLQQLAANTERLQALAQADYWPHRAISAHQEWLNRYHRTLQVAFEQAQKEAGTK